MIRADVDLTGQQTAQLEQAILVYNTSQSLEDQRSFVTVHDVTAAEKRAPTLGPGRLLSHAELGKLIAALHRQTFELIPAHVLALAPDRIAWFEPARKRHMFFKPVSPDPTVAGLSGVTFPQPALLWIAGPGTRLEVYALGDSDRPTTKTPLYRAPYWNIFSTHQVCVGTMRLPADFSSAATAQWSAAFFSSRFTHNSGGKIINSSGSYGQFLDDLRHLEAFPVEALVKTKLTLGSVVKHV